MAHQQDVVGRLQSLREFGRVSKSRQEKKKGGKPSDKHVWASKK
jgi:hypothetical protein